MLSLSSDMHCHYVRLCLKMWNGHPCFRLCTERFFWLQAVLKAMFMAKYKFLKMFCTTLRAVCISSISVYIGHCITEPLA